jgi:hypothetical protein
MPRSRFFQQHARAAKPGGRLYIQRVAGLAARKRDEGAIRRPHARRIGTAVERKTSTCTARKIERPQIARHAIPGILHHGMGPVGRQGHALVLARVSHRTERLTLPVKPGELISGDR